MRFSLGIKAKATIAPGLLARAKVEDKPVKRTSKTSLRRKSREKVHQKGYRSCFNHPNRNENEEDREIYVLRFSFRRRIRKCGFIYRETRVVLFALAGLRESVFVAFSRRYTFGFGEYSKIIKKKDTKT